MNQAPSVRMLGYEIPENRLHTVRMHSEVAKIVLKSRFWLRGELPYLEVYRHFYSGFECFRENGTHLHLQVFNIFGGE